MDLLGLPATVREQLAPAGRAIYACALAKHAGKGEVLAHAWAWAAVEKAGLLPGSETVIAKDDPGSSDVHVDGPVNSEKPATKRKRRDLETLIGAVTGKPVDLAKSYPPAEAAQSAPDARSAVRALRATLAKTAPQVATARGGAGIWKAAIGWLRKANSNHDPKGRFAHVAAAKSEEVKAFAEQAVADPAHRKLVLGAVENHERVRDATGLDLSGHRRTIDTSAVRHALSGHGDPAAEGARGQIALTPDDFARLPSVVGEPDTIEQARTTKDGRAVVRYGKRVNGHILYVEEHRPRRKETAMLTMWKQK